MNYRIVSDSSSNIFELAGVDYTTVPMKVIVGEKEYIDTDALDVQGMVEDLKAYKGKSGSSCPNVQEWLEAFGDADCVFGATISGGLSGSYNAAQQAARVWMEEKPGRRIHIFDTKSTGPQQMMLCEKLAELIGQGLEFDAIVEQAREYHNHTHILFCLESLTNLARNGRINPAAAKVAGMLGIRVVGDAKDGQITPVEKPRGGKKAVAALLKMLQERGFGAGKLLRIAHCFGESQASALEKAALEHFPGCRVQIEKTTALCSFYAETGGLIIGFEGDFNTNNCIN